jgi:hypothetical protein
MSTPGLISSLLRVFTPLLIGCDENTFALLIRNTRWRGLTHSEKYKKPKVRHNRRLMAVPAGRSVTYPARWLGVCLLCIAVYAESCLLETVCRVETDTAINCNDTPFPACQWPTN